MLRQPVILTLAILALIALAGCRSRPEGEATPVVIVVPSPAATPTTGDLNGPRPTVASPEASATPEPQPSSPAATLPAPTATPPAPTATAPPPTATVTPSPTPIAVLPTNVQFILALGDVNIRRGPGTQFTVIGFVAGGQTARVTGASADGQWWRVVCPDGTAGSCWVTAAPGLTQPTQPPAVPTRIQFAPGAISATVSSSLAAGGDGDSYVLRALAGQTMSLQLASTAVGAVTVYVHDENGTLLGAAQEPNALSLLLPATQDYTIDVRTPLAAGAVDYTLTVTIPPPATATPIPVHNTEVQYVLALQNVNILAGPGQGYGVVGQVLGGQIARVTGVSVDGQWWRVICPDDSVGNCWLTAAPQFTVPTSVPGP